MRRTLAIGGALLAVALAVPAGRAAAQQTGLQQAEARLREQRARLDSLRAERQELERRRIVLQSTVHDLSEELDNVNRQVAMTARVVQSLDGQLAAINADVQVTTAELLRAQDELIVKRVVLQRRLADIYKRGALYSSEVLLSASSFADLVARYKYLHLAALRDQALVKRVDALRKQIDRQRGSLVRFQEEIQVNLADKAEEERRLRGLQQEQAQSLTQAKARTRETERRLAALSEDEQRLTDVITQLEAARLKAERSSSAKAPSAIKKSGTGTLDWPVKGTLLYSFGRVVNPNNTTVRWNGIGINAAAGAEVRAVAAGTRRARRAPRHLRAHRDRPALGGRLLRVRIAQPDQYEEGGRGDARAGDRLRRHLRPRAAVASPLRAAPRRAARWTRSTSSSRSRERRAPRRARLDRRRRHRHRAAAREGDQGDGAPALHEGREPLGSSASATRRRSPPSAPRSPRPTCASPWRTTRISSISRAPTRRSARSRSRASPPSCAAARRSGSRTS